MYTFIGGRERIANEHTDTELTVELAHDDKQHSVVDLLMAAAVSDYNYKW